MTIEELRLALSIINEKHTPVTAVLHLYQKNGDVCMTDITTELQTELKEVFYHSLKTKYFDDPEFRFENISTALETVNTAFLYDIVDMPKELKVLEDFDPGKSDYKQFSIKDDGIEHTKGLLISIGTSTNYFTIYKHVHSISLIKPDKKKLLNIITSGKRLGLLTDDILKISGSIDFLYVNKKLIVDNVKTLSQNYGYHDIVKNQAKARINEVIKGLDLIDNITELTAFVENPRFAKKVMQIQPDSPVINLDRAKIIKFIMKHKKLNKKFRLSPSGKIILDTDVSKISMINILNDAYVKSGLTGINYESESKVEMGEED